MSRCLGVSVGAALRNVLAGFAGWARTD